MNEIKIYCMQSVMGDSGGNLTLTKPEKSGFRRAWKSHTAGNMRWPLCVFLALGGTRFSIELLGKC